MRLTGPTICQSATTAAFAIVLTSLNCGSLFAQTMEVTRVATGLSRPVYATTAPGDNNRLFVVEQHTGRIRIRNLDTGTFESTPFLTVTGLATGNEQGLLGLAFHPDYQTNGKFYVNFTASGGSGTTVVREYTRSSPTLANPASAKQVLSFAQPFTNHNGGWMDFGPDNMLYIASGDGGSGNDPQNNAQDITNNFLGKMLRVDVNGDDFAADPNRNYANPTNNPFVGVTGDDEIWAYGLRNPWRNSFDRLTGDLYIGDVGQGSWEEVNFQPGSSTGGENYGWKIREGANGGTVPGGSIDPFYDYAWGTGDLEGQAVTGGYVYRGPIAALQGHYFFGDFVNARIWSMKWDGSDPSLFNGTNFTDFIDWTDIIVSDFGSIGNVSSFAEDNLGNLYIMDFGGQIFRISAASIPEPGSLVLLSGLAGLMLYRRRRS